MVAETPGGDDRVDAEALGEEDELGRGGGEIGAGVGELTLELGSGGAAGDGDGFVHLTLLGMGL